MDFHLDEQEIGVSVNAADKEARVIVTGYKQYMRKLDLLCEKYPKEYKRTGEHKNAAGEVCGTIYTFPAKYIRFGHPASEAKRAAGKKAAERMLAMRK